MSKMIATIISGDTTLTGEAVVKKTGIEVKTHAFGKLSFDRATGKAKHGHSYIKNIAEILESIPPDGEEKRIWLIHRDPGWHDKGEALLCISVTRETPRKMAGTICEFEQICGKTDLAVSKGYEIDLPGGRYDRERAISGHFESRDRAVEVIANLIIDDAIGEMKDIDRWKKKYEHRYLGFVSSKDISDAIDRHFEGEKAERIRLDRNDKKIEDAVKKCHLIDYVINEKVPTIVMVDQPKKRK